MTENVFKRISAYSNLNPNPYSNPTSNSNLKSNSNPNPKARFGKIDCNQYSLLFVIENTKDLTFLGGNRICPFL